MQAAYEKTEAFNQKLIAEGKMIFGGGLMPADTSTMVRLNGGSPLVTDGPYLETKENLGGYWIIRAADLDEALAIAKEASIACANDVEVRPFQDDTPDYTS
jgi:hypothetical protein